jgi:hypothetical protein
LAAMVPVEAVVLCRKTLAQAYLFLMNSLEFLWLIGTFYC